MIARKYLVENTDAITNYVQTNVLFLLHVKMKLMIKCFTDKTTVLID